MSIIHKIQYSIDLLQKTEPLALAMHPDGFHLAFSGGKDSQVLYHIAQIAKVKFKAHMQLTTIDPPEVMRFVRKNYPDVILHRPEINFYNLIIKKKMLPLRHVRYCCAYLKEQAGAGTVTVTLIGIRKTESRQRSKRNEVEISGKKFSGSLDQFNRSTEKEHQCLNSKDKIIVSPIIYWTDKDVWDFIRKNNIEYCSLYDEGFHRIGCLFCPMANRKERAKERIRYPGVEKAIKHSIQTLIEQNGYFNNYNATADEIFNWWLSDENPKKYFSMLRGQTKLDF